MPQFIAVPYKEKEAAKALGAEWSVFDKTWFVPDGRDLAPFARWMASPANSESMKRSEATTPPPSHNLFVDLVPRSAWYSNLRSEVSKIEWDQIKRQTSNVAGRRCEACGGRGSTWPVECHERWKFDEAAGVQILLRTIALCPACHEATHLGLAEVKGRAGDARTQLMQVNGWSEAETERHIDAAFDTWRRRNEMKWALDARWLLNFVPLSEATRQNILAHAAGLIQR